MNDKRPYFHAYIDGELTSEEQHVFIRQLAQSDERQNILEQCQKQKENVEHWLSISLPETSQIPDKHQQLERFYTEIKTKKKRRQSCTPHPRSRWKIGLQALEAPLWLLSPVMVALLLLLQTSAPSSVLQMPTQNKQIQQPQHSRVFHPSKSSLRPKGNPVVLEVLYHTYTTRQRQYVLRIAKHKEPLSPGHFIKFRIHTTNRLHGMIVSLNQKGEVFPFVPFQGKQSRWIDGKKQIIPPVAWLELDDYLGPERFFFVASKKPFTLKEIQKVIQKQWLLHAKNVRAELNLPSPWYTASVLIEKRKQRLSPRK